MNKRDVQTCILLAATCIFVFVIIPLFILVIAQTLSAKQQEPVPEMVQQEVTDVDRSGTIQRVGDGNVYEARAVCYEVREDEVIVEDEHGTLWSLYDDSITKGDLVLLWLADNDTPQDNTDDVIVYVWKEAGGQV